MPILPLLCLLLATTVHAIDINPLPTPTGVSNRYSLGEDIAVRTPWMVVGMPSDGAGGRVFVYRYNNGQWAFHQELLAPVSLNTGAGFGTAVDVAREYNPKSTIQAWESFIAVGAPDYDNGNGNNEGALFLYKFNESSGLFESRASFIPQFVNVPNVENTGVRDFGTSVAIAGTLFQQNGDLIWDVLVGAPRAVFTDTTSTGTGAVFAFRRSPDATVWELNTAIAPGDVNGTNGIAISAMRFGTAVDANHGMAIIGAPDYRPANYSALTFGNSGAAWVTSFGGLTATWADRATELTLPDAEVNTGLDIGNRVAINAENLNLLVAGDPTGNSGNGQVFVWVGGQYTQTIRENGAGTRFGEDVDLAFRLNALPTQLIIGAPHMNSSTGAALHYLLDVQNQSFYRNQFFYGVNTTSPDRFGYRVSTDGFQFGFSTSPNVIYGQGNGWAGQGPFNFADGFE